MARAFADRAVQMPAIARVLVGAPRLLLVDEPKAGADDGD
jgi:ABC-type branched-subunit amino acid transport system ATPase component